VQPAQRPNGFEAVLRLVDARTGRPVEIDPGLRSPLRVCAHAPHPDALPDLRVLLTADVLARTAELLGGQALIGIATPGPTGDVIAALGIHPAAVQGVPDKIEEALGGPVDIHVIGASGAHPGRHAAAAHAAGLLLAVGAVNVRGVPGIADPDAEALAIRLALLARTHRQPADLIPERYAMAQRTLVRWRHAVADWARSPSKPMSIDVLRRALSELAGDLAIPGVLDALGRLERRTDIPAGAKFETFVYMDRVLGLELAREVGREQ
jgi:hypothetical protein